MLKNKNLYDMTGYDKNNEIWKKYHDDTNNKICGFFKDEY